MIDVLQGRSHTTAASGLLLGTAAIHMAAFREHYEVAPYIGVLFLLLALASVTLAVAVSAGSRTAWDLGALLSISAIIAYVLARTTGLPDYHESDWFDFMGAVPVGLLSVSVESAFVIVWMVRREH